MAIHLSSASPRGSSGTSLTGFDNHITSAIPLAFFASKLIDAWLPKSVRDSALHSGKDFAVSPSRLPLRFAPRLLSGRFFPFGKNRHCSHLGTCVRWALPTTVLSPCGGTCSDFPHSVEIRQARSPDTSTAQCTLYGA